MNSLTRLNEHLEIKLSLQNNLLHTLEKMRVTSKGLRKDNVAPNF